jgi:hypothetical protein
MKLASALGYREASSASSIDGKFSHLFRWFTGLQIPYETLTNIDEEVLIRTSEQLLPSIAKGAGGHCVEHSLLFADILGEHGFEAQVVNADHKDYISGLASGNSRSYVLVTVGSDQILADSLYAQTCFSVPKFGGNMNDGIFVRRLSEEHFSFAIFTGSTLVAEDIVNESVSLDDRRKLFVERYTGINPFGVFAPFFQTTKPFRKGIYYAPKSDSLVVHENRESFHLSDTDIPSQLWIPRVLRDLLPAALSVNRRDRSALLARLRAGISNPYYYQMKF